jgi:hypothetical protein
MFVYDLADVAKSMKRTASPDERPDASWRQSPQKKVINTDHFLVLITRNGEMHTSADD